MKKLMVVAVLAIALFGCTKAPKTLFKDGETICATYPGDMPLEIRAKVLGTITYKKDNFTVIKIMSVGEVSAEEENRLYVNTEEEIKVQTVPCR